MKSKYPYIWKWNVCEPQILLTSIKYDHVFMPNKLTKYQPNTTIILPVTAKKEKKET